MSVRLMPAALLPTLLALVSGCAETPETDPTQPVIQSRVEQIRSFNELSIGDSWVASLVVMPEFYERRNFLRAWTDPQAVDDLFRAITDIERDGLDPEDYHLATLQRLRYQVEGNGHPDSVLLADFDMLLTDALVRLGYHLLFGKVDPERLHANWNLAREIEHFEPAELMQDAIASGRLYEIIERYKPQHPLYVNLKRALAKYRAIKTAGGWPMIPDGPTLKNGVIDARVPLLRERLSATDDHVLSIPDTSMLFDDDLEAAVKLFQHRHGLSEVGAVGPNTLAALNASVAERIEQMRASLERGRWILHDLEDTFIAVNIAGFRVYYVKNGRIVWDSRAQVGRAYRKTPIFKSQLKYLVLNPTWTVPPSILAKDVLPRVREDPTYLGARGLSVIDSGGNVVDPTSVAWSAYTDRTLPYKLRQDPGPRNALGRVKFIFPNKHAVFLHDTPSRRLFDRDTRTFSSGCVRVENPLELAELVLDDPEKWSMEQIERAVGSRESRTVFLSTPIPVLLLYWTASVGLDGHVHFWTDVYDRDAAVLEGLRGEFRFRERPVLRSGDAE